jgi:hypothetical protein
MIALENPQTTQGVQWSHQSEDGEAASSHVQLVTMVAEVGGFTPIEFSEGAQDDTATRIALPTTEWTKPLEKEFLALAKRAALLTTTAEENERLKRLQVTRRRLRHPRSGEEIIWEFKQRQLTRNLVIALQDYVRFHSAESHPRASPKKEVHK